MTTERKPPESKAISKNVRARLRDEGVITDAGDMVVKAEFEKSPKDGQDIKRIVVESKAVDYEWGVAQERYVLEAGMNGKGERQFTLKVLKPGDSLDQTQAVMPNNEQLQMIQDLGNVLLNATKMKGAKVMSTEQTQRHIAQDIAMAVKSSAEGRSR